MHDKVIKARIFRREWLKKKSANEHFMRNFNNTKNSVVKLINSTMKILKESSSSSVLKNNTSKMKTLNTLPSLKHFTARIPH